MPGQMPEMLSRGGNLKKLDTLLAVATGKQQLVLDALNQLKIDIPQLENPGDKGAQNALRAAFLGLTVGHGIFTDDIKGDAAHFRDDWLPEAPQGWWPGADPVAPVLRRGFIKALEIALGKAPERLGGAPLDIETLWVCTPPTDQDAGTAGTGHVHVGITWNANLVTVIVYTPRLPDIGVIPGVPTDQVVVVRWDGSPKTGIVEKRPGV